MNFPDFTQDAGLNTLRAKMGAKLRASFVAPPLPPVVRVEPPRRAARPTDQAEITQALQVGGIEANLDEVHAHTDGTLIFEGRRVLIYIRDISTTHNELPRFHVAECRKIESMRKENRFARYVMSNRDDGVFLIKRTSGLRVDHSNERLLVCQPCLAALQWNDFKFRQSDSHRRAQVRSFEIKDFFAKYPKSLIGSEPLHTSETAPLNNYPDNWDDISKRTKKERGYRCEKCNFRPPLADQQRFLQTHHINGQKNDCSPANLAVLCLGCHAEKPLHAHMKNLPDYNIYRAANSSWKPRKA